MRVFLRLLIFLIITLLCFIFLLTLLPSFINTDWGKRQVVSLINRSIPGNIEIRRLNLHWFQGQKIEGFLLKDPEGQAVVGFDKFSTEATLWQLVWKNPHLGLTQIEDLNAAIITNENGDSNLRRALGFQTSKEVIPLASTIVLSDVDLKSYLLSPQHPLSIQMKGLTRQDNLNGSFDVAISLNGLFATTWEELKRNAENYFTLEGSKKAKLQATIVNFPLDLIDRLIALENPQYSGILHSLLGDRLNLNIEKEANHEGVAFNVALTTPFLQGDLKGVINKNNISLREPGQFLLKITPQTIQSLSSQKVNLQNPAQIDFVFSDFMIPLNFFDRNKESDLCQFGLHIDMKMGKTPIEMSSIGQRGILSLQGSLASPVCDKTIRLEVIGKIQQEKGKPFDIHLTSTQNKPSHLFHLGKQVLQNSRSNLTISKFPLDIIPFFHDHPEWEKKVGSFVNAQLEIQTNEQSQWLGIFSFDTPLFALQNGKLKFDNNTLTLLSPANFKWTMSSDCLQELFNLDSTVQDAKTMKNSERERFALEQPCPLQFVLKRLTLPIHDPQMAELELESSFSHLRLPKFFNLGTLQFDDFLLRIQSLNQKIHSTISGKFSLFNKDGSRSPLVPEPLAFSQNSKWKIKERGAYEMTSGQLQLINSITKVQIEGKLDSHQVFEITQPAQIHYTLSPSSLQILGKLFEKDLNILQEPTSFLLSIEPTQVNLNPFSLSNLYLQGTMQIKKMVFQSKTNEMPSLEEMFISWVFDSPRNDVYTNIKGLAYSGKTGKPSQVSANLQFWLNPGNYDFAHTKSEIRLNFSGLPTSLLNIFLGMPDLNSILGPILDINLKTFFDPTKTKPGYFDGVVDSANFHAEGRFKISDQVMIYDGVKLPIIRLNFDNESYKTIQSLLGFQDYRQLVNPVTVIGKLSLLNIPIDENWANQTAFNLAFSTTDIQWQNQENTSLKFNGNLATENLKDHFDFSLIAQGENTLKLRGLVKNLFDRELRLRPWQEMAIETTLEGGQLPISFFQSLLPLTSIQTNQIQALFGNQIDVNLKGHIQNLNGLMQASIKGPEGSILFDGQLKQGILSLNRPFETSVKVTPLFVRTFLTQSVPILNSAVGAENPITLTIDHAQFSVPLIPFKLEEAKIGKGNLNLGKVKFRNEGELHSVLSMIRSMTEPYLTIWFTPIYFDLSKANLSIKRFDMLVTNAFTLANWGSINLQTHQADFVLGLPAQTLQFAFGIQGLDDGYILQVPFHTAKGKVQVDKKKMTARVGALVAQTHGGDKGKLLGNILDKVLSEKGEPYPAPTTQPFPWSNTFSSQKATDQTASSETKSSQQIDNSDISKKKKEKKKKNKSQESTVIDLKDEALHLLNKWLK